MNDQLRHMNEFWDSGDFSLLCPTKKEIKSVSKKIHTALERCAERIKEIRKLHPSAGIGDTATDECIANEFYNKIH